MTNESKWSLNHTNSKITFQVRPVLMANLNGSFKSFDASFYMLANDFSTAEVNLWIDSGTVSTHDPKRDEHLRSIDFLDTINHSQITFNSNSVERLSQDGSYVLHGALTLKGISKKIKLAAQLGQTVYDSFGNKKVGFSITGRISRAGWGLDWNPVVEDGSNLKREEILIMCHLELANVRQTNLQMDLAQKAVTAFNENGIL